MRKVLFIILFFPVFLLAQEPIAKFSFENGLIDSIGSYNGVARGSVAYNTDYEKDGSYAINTNAGSMVTPPINFGSGGLTISFWFRSSETSGFPQPVSNRSAGVGKGLYFFLGASNQTLYLRTNDGSSENTASTASSIYNIDQLTHVAFRFMDTDVGYATIWVNGIRSGTDSTVQAGWTATDSLCVGGNRGGVYFYNGYIDKFEIYQYAVSDQKIADSLALGYTLGQAGGGGGSPPPDPPAPGDTSTLKKNFALDRHYILSGDAGNGDIVGELMIAQYWDTTTSVSYSLQYDTSGYFSIAGDSIIADNVSALQSSKWYRITYKINDGDYYDSAYAYIYKPPADSCFTVTDWDAQSLLTGRYYFQARGTTETITSTIGFSPSDDVYCGAIGNGVRPIINKGYNNGGSAEEGIFTVTGADDIWIQSFALRPNGYNNTNIWYSDGIFGSGFSGFIADNLDINGYSVDLEDYFSYSFRFYSPTDLTVRFCIEKYTIHGNWVSNCTGFRGISNNHSHNDYLQDIPGYDISDSGADCWMFSNDIGGNDHSQLYFGYNYADKSSHANKSAFIFGGSTDGTNDRDTVEWNRIIGFPEYNATYPGAGIAMSGASGTVVRYNHIKNVGRGLFIFHETGSSWTNTNVEVYNNLFENCYYTSIHFNLESDGSTVYNNTFIGYGDSTATTGNSAIALRSDNITVKNNLFYDTHNEEPYYASGGATIDYNLYYDRQSRTLAANEIEGDPKLNSNYTLQYDSPAINAGQTLTILGYPNVDLKYDAVPYDEAWDIGCYEYVVYPTTVVETPNTIFMKRRFITVFY